MKLKYIILMLVGVFVLSAVEADAAESTRKERRFINMGNDAYKERNFVEAQSFYERALNENSGSAEARYNLGLSRVRQITNLADTSATVKAKLDAVKKDFADVAALAKEKPGLAAKANLNLGNIEFKARDFQKAIDYYKQALRIDPSDDKARKNLRIAQLNLKKQQDQNKDQDKDQEKDKDKDKDKDRNKDQDKDRNKDQDKDQDKDQNQQQDKKEQPKDNNISQQSAERILKAMDNKESATRARVQKGQGKNAASSASSSRRW